MGEQAYYLRRQVPFAAWGGPHSKPGQQEKFGSPSTQGAFSGMHRWATRFVDIGWLNFCLGALVKADSTGGVCRAATGPVAAPMRAANKTTPLPASSFSLTVNEDIFLFPISSIFRSRLCLPAKSGCQLRTWRLRRIPVLWAALNQRIHLLPGHSPYPKIA